MYPLMSYPNPPAGHLRSVPYGPRPGASEAQRHADRDTAADVDEAPAIEAEVVARPTGTKWENCEDIIIARAHTHIYVYTHMILFVLSADLI